MGGTGGAALSADTYKYWSVDFVERKLTMHLQDGQKIEEGLPDVGNGALDSPVAQTIFDWERWWIFSITKRGDGITTEGYNPQSPPPLHGRPTVYLDQGHWSTLADAVWEPSRIRQPARLKAAQELMFLAADGGIILPLSTGHMGETSALDNEQRYRLGVTMAKFSAGWQMRHPIDSWKAEAALAVASYLGRAAPAALEGVVCNEPGAMFGRHTSLALPDDASDYDMLMAMLTMPNVVLSVLIDPEPLASDPLTGWVMRHEGITARINQSGGSKDQRRAVARRRFYNENLRYYVSAFREMTGSEDSHAFSDRELKSLLAASPLIGLLSELFVRRFMDRRAPGHGNDLVDMLFLSSAAAYADYVAAEKRTGLQLREAQRSFGRKPNVQVTLEERVTALRRDGVQAASERAEP